jgi:hypothetical protein
VTVANVEKDIETTELGKDAASEPVMVLEEAEHTAAGDIPAQTFHSTVALLSLTPAHTGSWGRDGPPYP